jgi:hypothetical protein
VCTSDCQIHAATEVEPRKIHSADLGERRINYSDNLLITEQIGQTALAYHSFELAELSVGQRTPAMRVKGQVSIFQFQNAGRTSG